ncbi:hypothetical protein WY02_03480 [Pseudonocardia sp. AL041005-10]|nr:hypothetical protein [Pseudonocardia sp. AL041005-10]ALE77665.1 hypothetical protein WY02_03480 [Pseudonocardia sp. AL041005-10]
MRAEEVTARIAPEVFRQLVTESRAQRAVKCRADLGTANALLEARGLPPVADPGPAANADQVCTRASTAQVFSVLPDEIATRLLDESTDGQLVFPLPDLPRPGGQPGTVPADPGGSVGTGGQAPPPGGTSTAPSSRTVPPPTAPAPIPGAPRDNGLLPDFLPIPRLLQPLLSA